MHKFKLTRPEQCKCNRHLADICTLPNLRGDEYILLFFGLLCIFVAHIKQLSHHDCLLFFLTDKTLFLCLTLLHSSHTHIQPSALIDKCFEVHSIQQISDYYC